MNHQEKSGIDTRTLHDRANEILHGHFDLADASLLRQALRRRADELQQVGDYEIAIALRNDELAIGEWQLATHNYGPEERRPGNDDDTEIE